MSRSISFGRLQSVTAWLCMVGLSPVACKKTGQTADALATAPSLEDATGQAKCSVKKSGDRPLVIEWPAAERAALEARATRGLVAVRYSGCEMEVLTTCSASGEYEYVGLTQKTEGVRITNSDQLYAQLPIGAAGLETKLERTGQLNVDMTIVGRREATESRFGESSLIGRCEDATHVVTGLTVGSFSFYTGKSAEVGGGVRVSGVGAGAGSTTDQQILKTDGDVTACASAGSNDTEPPEGCGALLRVEVVPVDRVMTSTTSPSDAGASGSDEPPLSNDEYKKQMAIARGLYLGGYAGMLVGVGMVVAGPIVYERNKDRLESETSAATISGDRELYVRRAKTGIGITIAGAAVGIVGIGIAALGSSKTRALRGGLSLSPAVGPRQAGLNLEGRF